MRLRCQELERHLKQGLAPVYLLSGDEPLQMGEAADAIRSAARLAGCDARNVLDVERGFNWDELGAEADSLSLFSEQRIIDLRIPSGKPGSDGSKALQAYTEALPEDTLLLITMPKLDKSQTNTKWFKALDQVGVTLQIWPINGSQLSSWIEQRMRSRGIEPATGVVSMLAERIEGNLLAAAQEIEKILLFQGPGQLSLEQLTTAVSDSARYSVFDLADSALAGQATRCVRILNGLQAEGTPPPIVLWALTREVRMLSEMAYEVATGSSPQQVINRRRGIWAQRKGLVSKGLTRLNLRQWQQLLRLCGRADRTIKGREKGDPWLLFQHIATRIAGLPVIVRP